MTPRALPWALYTCPTLPEHWVASDGDGGLWIVAAAPDAWARRTPYRGYASVLTRASSYCAVGIGWPGMILQGTAAAAPAEVVR